MTVPMQTAVERLIDARSSHRLMAPLSETYGDLSLADTAPTGQAIMGVKEPAYGFLPPHQYAGGAEVSAGGFADLRVEAEVAFRMRTKLVGPGVTAANAA